MDLHFCVKAWIPHTQHRIQDVLKLTSNAMVWFIAQDPNLDELMLEILKYCSLNALMTIDLNQ